MTGERQFNEADALRLEQFRLALEGLRRFLPAIRDEQVRSALLALINALDALTHLTPLR